ncbi:MAG: ATP adenylyltransferase [Alteromonadaceae bacterium]|jgi:ATP adenylyltransferase
MFWSSAQQVAKVALANNSLLPISTKPMVIEQNGIHFYLHVLNANLQRKINHAKTSPNPFSPYNQDMYVGPAGDSHVCLLNKFPVLAPHLLICSKPFIEQSSPLDITDFTAWLLGYDQSDIFGFYNGGRLAGASQPHRHMQLVKTDIPLAPLILSSQLPFKHRLFVYDKLDAQALMADYLSGMNELGLYDSQQCQPYNLLLTNSWMLIIPRSTNNLNGIFANGINYSGHFLIKNQSQIDWLTEFGIIEYLSQCSIPKEAPSQR